MAHQYDQYAQGFTIKCGDTTITPNDIDGLEIRINDVVYTYPADIVYSSNKWYVLLTSEQTSDKREMKIQCEIDFGSITQFPTKDKIVHTDITKSQLKPSLDWGDDE